MSKPIKIRKPRTDDRLPWNVVAAIQGTPAVLVAYQLNLFSLLAEKPQALDEICKAKGLKHARLRRFWRSQRHWVLRAYAGTGIR